MLSHYWVPQIFLGKRDGLGHWLLKCDPQSSSTQIPRKLLELEILRPQPRPTELEMRIVGPEVGVLVSPPENSDVHSSLRTTGIGDFMMPDEKFSNWYQGPNMLIGSWQSWIIRPVQISLSVLQHGRFLCPSVQTHWRCAQRGASMQGSTTVLCGGDPVHCTFL